jgi:hypothetical protein
MGADYARNLNAGLSEALKKAGQTGSKSNRYQFDPFKHS